MKTPNYTLVMLIVLASTTAAVLSAPTADPPTEPSKSAFRQYLEQDYMLGDWGGLRTRLKKHGVDFEFLYLGAIPCNLEGGLKRGSVYEGGLMMLLDLDSEKLLGYKGGQVHVAGLNLHSGDEFAKYYVGDLNKTSLLDFPDNFNLWELWYEQKLFDGKVALKFGQLVVDRDFIVPEYYNSLAGITFLNQTFFYPTMAFNVWDQPLFPVGNHALASTPYGAPGVRLRVDPTRDTSFQIGVYDGNPDRSRGGTDFTLSDQEGALIYTELGIKINQTREAKGPPGNLKIGGYYHTDDFYDMSQGALVAFDNYVASQGLPVPPISNGTAPTHKGNYGVYALADQTLWREIGKDDPARQGLTGFVRVAAAPEDRNLATWGLDGGLVYKGLIPTRDWDTLGVALSYLSLSNDLEDAQRFINTAFGTSVVPLADYEAVIELNYRAQMTAWWSLQTSVQRVLHPGGRVLQDTPNAWVLAVQTVFRF